MRKYHHIGIPTDIEHAGETYLERYRLFCTDHEQNPFGIQWMRFEPECTLTDVVVAFVLVDGAPVEFLQFVKTDSA